MKNELWKAVPGFEGEYEVSNQGRLKSYKSGKETILKTTPDPRGYRPVLLSGKTKKRYWLHRLVAEVWIPNPKNRVEVNHKNGDKKDCRVENLEWVSRSQNIRHAYESGLMPTTWQPGSRNHNAKFTDDQVREIRRLYEEREKSQKDIALAYNTTIITIHRMLRRKSYAHVR